MNVIHHSASNHEESRTTVAAHNYFEWILRIGIMTIFVLGVIYLILSNAIAMRGFVLQELKQESVGLKKQIEDVDIEIAMTTSLYAIQSSEQVQEMPYAKDKQFLTVKVDSGMAYLGNGRMSN